MEKETKKTATKKKPTRKTAARKTSTRKTAAKTTKNAAALLFGKYKNVADLIKSGTSAERITAAVVHDDQEALYRARISARSRRRSAIANGLNTRRPRR